MLLLIMLLISESRRKLSGSFTISTLIRNIGIAIAWKALPY